MKSLQNQYNLIKEGKGNKEIFLKEVKAQFPQYITNVQTFDQVIHSLTEKGIINETMVLVSANRPTTPDWFKVFNENTEAIKAELKDTDKSVTEKETAGYNYEDRKNNNNLSTAEILNGYYAEMKDPKNADKTETEIKAIVFKNLEKDPLYYVKNAAFGIKGIGYSDNQPGLGATKEVTGKYKSSGMEPVKLNESLTEAEEEMYVVYSYPDGHEDEKELHTKNLKLRDAKLRAGNLNIMHNREDFETYNYMKQSDWEAQHGSNNLEEDKVAGSNIKKVGDKWRILSGKTGKMWKAHYDTKEDAEAGLKAYFASQNESLTEAKKRAIEKQIDQIEKMGEVAAWENRIMKTQEKIDELTKKMTVAEGDDVKEYINEKAVKDTQRDIKLLEKKKALYEKQKNKAAKKVSNKPEMQTATGEDTTVMEKEEPFTPPADPIGDTVKASMIRTTAPKPKKKSWTGMVRELINTKNLTVK